MKTIYRTYRYALLPNKAQETLLSKHFGCARYVFNRFLNEGIEQYRSAGKSDRYKKQALKLTRLKKTEEMIWLKEVNRQSLQFALRCLDLAYLNFFEGRAKFPRFKSRKGKNSFTVPQFVKVEAGRLFFPKFKEGIRLKLHRTMEGEVKYCTVSRTPTGKYFVSILCQVQHKPKEATGKSCGIDLGITDFAVTSDGKRYANSRELRTYEKRLTKAQRHLSRKIRGSNNRNKQRLKVAGIHEKIANTRMDLLHQISTQITNEYDIICVEDLNIRGMMTNRKLAKHIGDASWGHLSGYWNTKQAGMTNRLSKSAVGSRVQGPASSADGSIGNSNLVTESGPAQMVTDWTGTLMRAKTSSWKD